MLGILYKKTYGATTNYDAGYDGGNEYVNDEKNAASRSGSDGMIQSCHLGIMEEDQTTAAMALQTRHTIYIRVVLYIYPIKTLLKMCHKLLYAKFGVLDWC